jgi:hypothetical protein
MAWHIDDVNDENRGLEPIESIFNYCDRWCERCRFTARCTLYRDLQEDEAAYPGSTLVETVHRQFEKTRTMLAEDCEREGIDFASILKEADESKDEMEEERARLHEDPLVVTAKRYTGLVYPILQALDPVVRMRGDQTVIEAIDTLEWFHAMIAAKIYRALSGLAAEPDNIEVQTDFNGSARVARLGIAQSIAAWRVLMEMGRATADGVPAKLVTMLEELDAELATRFPRAAEFIRPGFDEGAET